MTRPLLAIFLAFAISVQAETIVPLPRVHEPAWQATDIVVVAEGEVNDGNVEVLETWKGNLARGARITVPALAAFAEEERLTGRRILLFLIADGGQWQPAHGSMQESTAWIEDGMVFVIEYRRFSRPHIRYTHNTEAEWKAWTGEALAMQQALREALPEADPAKIEAAVPSFFRADSDFLAETAIAALGDAGPKAVPALRRILSDDLLGWQSDDAVEALVKAAGDAAPAELAEVLAEDLAFWRRTASELKDEWWSDPELPEIVKQRLTTRYSRLETALAALRDARMNEAGEVVGELCVLWQSSPQLHGEGGGELQPACDAVLKDRP